MAEAQERTVEDRIRAIEDRLAIYNLIASHPPSADTGAQTYIRSIFADDGVLERQHQLLRAPRRTCKSVQRVGPLARLALSECATRGNSGDRSVIGTAQPAINARSRAPALSGREDGPRTQGDHDAHWTAGSS